MENIFEEEKREHQKTVHYQDLFNKMKVRKQATRMKDIIFHDIQGYKNDFERVTHAPSVFILL